nr:site-specific integrase [Brevundimonas diminuta]
MAFLLDPQELKTGLIIFRRGDVKHRKWYCRIKLPEADRYKITCLKTTDIDAARERAFDEDADLRFRIKHDVPIFNRPFSAVAKDFLADQKVRMEVGEITWQRLETIDSAIHCQLNPYVGAIQVNLLGQDRWTGYPVWRRLDARRRKTEENERQERLEVAEAIGDKKALARLRAETPRDRRGRIRLPTGAVSDATIRTEMSVFRSVMAYAAAKKLISESQVFKGKLPLAKVRREAFTPEEYRHLHTYARKWVKEARTKTSKWYRTMAYNFVLIMCNTGMRPPEAKNLRWRDIAIRRDDEGRALVVMRVRGKGKFRELVAAGNVAEYLERIREISKATALDDAVFTTDKGDPASTLYESLIDDLLDKSGLRISATGKPRSTYCFRHTYATFRLTEGVDVYFLAKQMGTSVKMIEDHYGHVTPVKNAERILQGLPGWKPMAETPQVEAADGSVNGDEAEAPASAPRPPRRKAA